MKRICRAVVMTTAALALAACGASVASNGSADPPFDPPATGEVIGQGTVVQKGDGQAQLCLGPIDQPYPLQPCGGPEIVGWDWAAVEQSETAGGVTWGSYAVQGTWNGTTFTLTQDPIPLSLYSPPADEPHPRLDESNPGAASDDELRAIQTDILDSANGAVLTASLTNGYVLLLVFYDDGTLQEYFDRQYGPDIIAVQSALRPLG